MLSPNATYCVRLTVGGGLTVTVNEHVPVWPRVSTPVHVTRVAPMLNSVSLPGVQVIWIGRVAAVARAYEDPDLFAGRGLVIRHRRPAARIVEPVQRVLRRRAA